MVYVTQPAYDEVTQYSCHAVETSCTALSFGKGEPDYAITGVKGRTFVECFPTIL